MSPLEQFLAVLGVFFGTALLGLVLAVLALVVLVSLEKRR